MSYRVAINGFGLIGRNYIRFLLERGLLDRGVTIVGVNDPARLPWAELGVDLVIESTGKLRARDDAAAHLKVGARRVLLSAPGKGADVTLVMGVNEETYDRVSHEILSAASCTTNCVA